VQILPFTPSNRENTIAWLAVKSNPDRYGRQIAYQFGKDTLYFGPKQVESRIDQDPIISAQLALWNQQGTQVIRGNLLVFPIGGGLLYVEPLYLQAATGRIPELKRVIVATADQVVMEENLGLALARIFGQQFADADVFTPLFFDRAQVPVLAGSTIDSGAGTTALELATLEELIAQANDRYTQSQTALRDGNWAEYGTQIEALQQILQQLAQVTGVPVVEPEEELELLPEEESAPAEPSADTTP
jgi:uncharacterized protein